MTNFKKENFNYHGGFLMYTGDYEGRPVYGSDAHPSRVGTGKDLFIARFKYRGPVTKAQFVKELMKNWTVEEYVAATGAPLEKLRDKNPSWYQKLFEKYRAKMMA